MKNLSVSIIIPTFNSAKTIDACLKSIKNQEYPKSKIEIIIVDGGSTDDTIEIVSKYKPKIINVPPKKQNVELNKSLGIQKARNEIIFLLDHDNVLQSKKIISQMLVPFVENRKIVGVETLRYYYDKKRSVLDKYIALFGVTDPLAFYFGKADRLSYIYSSLGSKYGAIDRGKYYEVKFTPSNLPTIGANGFMIRRSLLINKADSAPGKFYHTDVNLDLIKKGYDTYAFTKNSIAHLGGRGSVFNFLTRRMFFMRQFYFSDSKLNKDRRRYSLYTKKDFGKLLYVILISVTLVKPIADSLRGYIKIRDLAWFINPVLCLGFVTVYGYVVVEHKVKNIFGID
ncbi:MAG TPA: glycosyltransferase [Patescibacteria group bacterium]|nr:glycosyltransferase [Patescibacteria group bacterium]